MTDETTAGEAIAAKAAREFYAISDDVEVDGTNGYKVALLALAKSAKPQVAYTERPQGDAGDAIDFACGHCAPDEAVAFLDDWRMDRANEWPGYMKWLAAQGMSAGTAETVQPAQGEARQPGPKDAPNAKGNPGSDHNREEG